MFAPTTDQPIETLHKEDIPSLHFGHDDILAHDLTSRQRRRHDADRAAALGNAHHGKLDIFFQTADGQTKRVQTAVWAADSEHLTLKSGISLPMRAVLGFDFY